MEENNRKMNFFTRIYKSIMNFDTYIKFANEPISKAIKYLAILVLIFSLIITALYISSFKSKISTGLKYLKENVEEMHFDNRLFSYNNNEYHIYDDEKNIIPIIIVDTGEEPNIEEYKNKVKLYDYGFIVLKDKVMAFISTQGAQDGFTTISYADYNIENMTKEEMLGVLSNPIIYFYLAVAVFIVEFIQYFTYILLNAIVLAIMGQLLARILKLRMKFSETYKMGIYALTLPTILELLYIIVNTLTGFVIPYFSWMYTTISYIYICVAILMIKTDFINMQKELIRIKMEEEKDKEEQEETREEKNDEEKDKKEDKETDEETDEKNDLKEQTDG